MHWFHWLSQGRWSALIVTGWLALGWLLPTGLAGDDVALVRIGEYWRYWQPAADPGPTPEAWRQLAFDDNSWGNGRMGFGYSDGATMITDFWARNSRALWVRKKFTVTDPAQIQWLVLRADYQDGMVAYLNGVEVARRGFPEGSEVPFSAFATNLHPDSVAEDIDLSAQRALLQTGENILAIQVHTAGMGYTDFFLSAELLANFTRGPFLQDASTNRVKIIWHTPVAADSTVEYGLDSSLGKIWTDPAATNVHVASLEGLIPGADYYYRVKSGAGEQTAISPIYRFRTLRAQGGFSFLALGDTGMGREGQYRIAEVMRASPADLVMHLGDVVYPQFTLGRADLKCFSVYQPDMARRPWYFLYGNHDRYANFVDFPAVFYSPTNPVTGGEEFYSFDQGCAHMVVLDVDLGVGIQWEEGSPQYRWLEADLAATQQPWKFLFFHNALRSSGPHRDDDYNSNGIRDELEFQNTIGKLATRYGVQAIFTAHEHVYERLNPQGGTHGVISGGAGGTLYYFGGEWDASSCQFSAQYHCLHVQVEPDYLELRALDMNGQTIDTMHLGRTAPARQLYRSTWHTPTLAFAGTPDGYGNLEGQKFDFAGAPLRTVAGDFSNLGNFYVNHDSNTLYLGFNQAMFYSSNNVFLFLESPRLPGVTNLAGLGDGVWSPETQGSEGLDFLENLGFANFAPSVGVVLGDEGADGQRRSFYRWGMNADIGQGAFYLNATFSDVPDIRLQQFNRSPQHNPVTHEQNADFMVLAVPFSALGGIQLGDTLKVGAVVGGSLIDTNATRPWRQLDRSYLGYSFSGEGMQPAQLEGIEVLLTAPAVDTDGDGMPDAEEKAAGTDPLNPQSLFKISAEMKGTHTIRVQWSAVPGGHYVIEQAVGVIGGFIPVTPLANPLVATTQNESCEVPLTLDSQLPRFYRVRLLK